MQKGLVPPPHLDKLALDSMTEGGHGKKVGPFGLKPEIVYLLTGKDMGLVCPFCDHKEVTGKATEYLELLEVVEAGACAWIPLKCSQCGTVIMPTKDEVLASVL